MIPMYVVITESIYIFISKAKRAKYRLGMKSTVKK